MMRRPWWKPSHFSTYLPKGRRPEPPPNTGSAPASAASVPCITAGDALARRDQVRHFLFGVRFLHDADAPTHGARENHLARNRGPLAHTDFNPAIAFGKRPGASPPSLVLPMPLASPHHRWTLQTNRSSSPIHFQSHECGLEGTSPSPFPWDARGRRRLDVAKPRVSKKLRVVCAIGVVRPKVGIGRPFGVHHLPNGFGIVPHAKEASDACQLAGRVLEDVLAADAKYPIRWQFPGEGENPTVRGTPHFSKKSGNGGQVPIGTRTQKPLGKSFLHGHLGRDGMPGKVDKLSPGGKSMRPLEEFRKQGRQRAFVDAAPRIHLPE